MNKVSHLATRKEESYMVSFDNKIFGVKVRDCKRHYKLKPEITEIEVTREITHEERSECIKLVMDFKKGKSLLDKKQGKYKNDDMQLLCCTNKRNRMRIY
jgi:hypothetical protein